MPFSPILLYIDGRKVKDDVMQVIYDQKLNTPLPGDVLDDEDTFDPEQFYRKLDLDIIEEEFIDLGPVGDLA
jgi:hypothetical protein